MISVHAISVGLCLINDLLPLIAENLAQKVGLIRNQFFSSSTGYEALSAGHKTKGIDTRHISYGGPGWTTAQRYQELPVANGDPASPKGHIFACFTGNVGYAKLVVNNSGARTTSGLFEGFPNRLKVLGQKQLFDIFVSHIAAQRRQSVVQRQLIERILRRGNASIVTWRQNIISAVFSGRT